MNSSPTSGPDRRLARNQGLSRLTAVTLGAAAASLVGAAAIAVTLHSASTTANADATTVAPSPQTNREGDGFGSEDTRPQDSSPDGSLPQLQPGAPPSSSDNAPGATSGGS